MRIAALKDEAGEFEAIRQAIEDTGHDCHGLGDEQLLLACLRRNACDLLILDLKLPELDRLRLVKRLRQEFGARLPILSVAASRHEQDMVDALSAGADDFMAKPWRTSELQARVHALLRRSHQHLDESVLNFGPFRFYLATRTLQVNGRPIVLKSREYDLALFLFKNIGRLLTREQLMSSVWGSGLEGPTRSLDTHMSRLRTKLGLRPAHGVLLSAAYGHGYRLEFIRSDAFDSQAAVGDMNAGELSDTTQGAL
ncbi:Two-component system response regulator [Burkholderiales bacterium 8X]|nr:Two-component system response regulator [Burkholderiales bacterium 8X]